MSALGILAVVCPRAGVAGRSHLPALMAAAPAPCRVAGSRSAALRTFAHTKRQWHRFCARLAGKSAAKGFLFIQDGVQPRADDNNQRT